MNTKLRSSIHIKNRVRITYITDKIMRSTYDEVGSSADTDGVISSESTSHDIRRM